VVQAIDVFGFWASQSDAVKRLKMKKTKGTRALDTESGTNNLPLGTHYLTSSLGSGLSRLLFGRSQLITLTLLIAAVDVVIRVFLTNNRDLMVEKVINLGLAAFSTTLGMAHLLQFQLERTLNPGIVVSFLVVMFVFGFLVSVARFFRHFDEALDQDGDI
jgi:hypothetical protein